MNVELPHWHFSDRVPELDDVERLSRADRRTAEACRTAMRSREWAALENLERLGVRFTPLVGVTVRNLAAPILDVIPRDGMHSGARAQLSHMVSTRDGGETLRIIRTLAVRGRF